MSYKDNPITVWLKVRTEERTCEYGMKHFITLWAPKRLGPVIGTRPFHDGYDTPLRQDYQGRTYHAHFAVDYCGITSWWRDEDKKAFVSRMPSRGVDVTKEPKWQG